MNWYAFWLTVFMLMGVVAWLMLLYALVDRVHTHPVWMVAGVVLLGFVLLAGLWFALPGSEFHDNECD